MIARTWLWSAAVPGQGGHEHINEQFMEYWIELFQERGFSPYDVIRPQIWGDPKVQWWYQQNLLVFANQVGSERFRLRPTPIMLNAIHPALYNKRRDPTNYSLRSIIRFLPFYIARLGERRTPKTVVDP